MAEKDFVKAREIKKAGRGTLKKHYWLLVLMCVLAALIGSQFGSSIQGLTRLGTTIQGVVAIQTLMKDPEALAALVQEEEERQNTVLNQDAVGAAGLFGEESTASSVLAAIINDGVESGSALAQQIQEQSEFAAGDSFISRTQGILARVVNFFSSGSLWVTLVSGMRNVFHSDGGAIAAAVFLAVILSVLYYVFIRLLFRALLCRFFMESRIYGHIPYAKALFFQINKKWLRSSLTMLLTEVFTFLWSLTIVGFFIKRYSYFMVPYIVAENPEIRPREAVTLSRRIMNGHKWDCFVKELSFIGWEILNVITFGLTGIFYSNAYKTAAFAEYYVWIRSCAKKNQIENADKLNDTWLFECAPLEDLEAAYAEEKAELDEERTAKPERNKALSFVNSWFGMVAAYTPQELAYEEQRKKDMRLKESRFILNRQAYPTRLSPITGRMKERHIEGIYYMRNYSFIMVCFFFLSFSVVGWIWEVSLHLVNNGTFVNRGVLHGPWLPIYGGGSILVLLLMKKLRNKPILHFLGTILLCGLVEYFSGLALELTHDGQKWWDYSGYFINFSGRVCGEGLIAFGILGTLAIYIIAPVFDMMLRKVPQKLFTAIVLIAMCVFIADNIYSSKHPNMGEGITSNNSIGEVMVQENVPAEKTIVLPGGLEAHL